MSDYASGQNSNADVSASASDPAGTTEQFRAFVHNAPQAARSSFPLPLIAGLAVGALAVVALVVALVVA